jgi:hypothetical protein
MDPFVRKLVLRLFDEGAPLSRNRHFHTFDSPEGRKALRVSKRLKTLQREIEACSRAGGDSGVRAAPSADGRVRVELRHAPAKGLHVATLEHWEYELLRSLPGVRDALG